MGLDSDKLESLRVSASKASPMGDTLDLCARYADSKTLEEMVQRQGLNLSCFQCLQALSPN